MSRVKIRGSKLRGLYTSKHKPLPPRKSKEALRVLAAIREKIRSKKL